MDKNGITTPTEDRTTFSTVNDTNDENGQSDTIWQQEEPSDDPETVRNHISTITRTMQAFHVRELVWDEATAKRQHHSASDHHHVPHLSARTTNETPSSTFNYHRVSSNETNNCMDSLETGPSIQPLAQHQQFDNEQCGLPTKQTCSTLSSSPFAEKEASIQQLWNPLDSVPDTPHPELQWTMEDATVRGDASIHDNDDDDKIWRDKFMALMASLVTQCEHLDNLSTELSSAEDHVRALLSLAATVQDQFYEREKHYQDQLREFDVAGQRQSMMLDTLDELMLDMDTKLSASSSSSSTFLQRDEHTDSMAIGNRQPALEQPSSSVTMGTDSFVHKARWKVGMLFGSDVGTGDIIQTFQPSVGVEMLISGSGIVVDNINRATLDQVPNKKKEEDGINHSLTFSFSYRNPFTPPLLLNHNRQKWPFTATNSGYLLTIEKPALPYYRSTNGFLIALWTSAKWMTMTQTLANALCDSTWSNANIIVEGKEQCVSSFSPSSDPSFV